MEERKKERGRIIIIRIRIRIIIRNEANTICLPNFVWGDIITKYN